MKAWLQMWAYRISERLTPRRPEWLHRLVCSHCRGLDRYVAQQERARRAAA